MSDSPLTNEMTDANEKFFNLTHCRLNDGGIWQGDNATMYKHGAKWYATLPNYTYMKMIVSSEGLAYHVILIGDVTGTMTDLELFKQVVKANKLTENL